MSEFLRKYWFIVLVVIALCGGLVYYIMDLNKDNVSAKTVDGKQVVASTTLGDVTADTVYDNYQSFNQSLLYNMYRNAVVEQSVETTEQMKTDAKKMAKILKNNIEADTTGQTRFSILSELASYGYEGEDKLYDYALMTYKQKVLDDEYVKEHYTELKDSVTSEPRTISVITLTVPNAEILTDDAKTKQENIQKALDAGDDFGSVATAFSDDQNTVANDGFFGYVDNNSTDLDSAVVSAASKLKKGETSDWITTQNSQTGMYVLYKVHVDETDMDAIFNSDNEDVHNGLLAAIINANTGLEVTIVEDAAKKLDIQFDNETVKTQIEDYIAKQTGGSKDE